MKNIKRKIGKKEMEFKEFDLAPEILQAIEEKGYTAPTPIQQQAIPALLSGEDLLGCAQTGTGKTAAFALPILQKLFASWDYKHQIRALILTPTRELALQIYENFLDYGKHLPLRCCVIFGGVSQNPQTQQLKEGVDVLIATPGRLLDLMGQGFISLKHTEYYVLDEADRMLDMGFLPDVRRITGKLPQDRQTMLFSATMPPEIARLAQKLLHNPVEINVSPVSRPVELIAQRVYLVDKGNKSKLLAHLIQHPAHSPGPGVRAHQARGRPGGASSEPGGHHRPGHPRQTRPRTTGSGRCKTSKTGKSRCWWPLTLPPGALILRKCPM